MTLSPKIIHTVSNIAPGLGSLLGGPIGGAVGYLISSVMGIDTSKPEDLIDKINNDPQSINKLKTLESQLKDLESAREESIKEVGLIRWVRPFLVILAFFALFIDVILIMYVENDAVKQILLVMMGILVFDLKQIYKFYFGSGEEVSAIFPFGRKK